MAGEALLVDVSSQTDRVNGDADSCSILDGLEETLLTVALDIELLAKAIFLDS